MDEGYDVVIASRALPGSNVEVRQPWYRENMGRLFNFCVRVLALPGLQDTQCGFKLFSAEAAEKAFEPARLDGFSFDVEALFIARRRGFRIAEVPVTWRNDAATRVGTLKGAVAFLDLARIRWQRLARALRRVRGRSRRRGVVADLRRLPQLLHPALDAARQVLLGQAGADRGGRLLE